MAWTPETFVDGSAGGTPITAAALNNIENELTAIDPMARAAISSVTPANGTITIAGTATAPTVAATVGTAAGTVAAGNDARFAASISTITAAATAAAFGRYAADATSAAFTVTLPTGPAAGASVSVTKIDSSVNAVTVVCPTGATFADGTTTMALAGQNVGGVWVYDGTSKWVPQSGSPGTATAYTPVLTASTTNPTLGNSTLTGQYVQNGHLVHVEFELTIGSTFAVGSGYYLLSLPVATAATGSLSVGTVVVSNSGLNKTVLAIATGTTHLFFVHCVADALLDNTGPGAAWASGNTLGGSVTYLTA